MSKGESKEYRTRLKEITSVLHKYGITRGITPQKLRMILEDLGPTYIKIGQIMSLHSDILPKRYCDELMCLRSEVTPMEFPEVKEVIEQAYGCPWLCCLSRLCICIGSTIRFLLYTKIRENISHDL